MRRKLLPMMAKGEPIQTVTVHLDGDGFRFELG